MYVFGITCYLGIQSLCALFLIICWEQEPFINSVIDSFKILSCNCNGASDRRKLGSLFTYLQLKHLSIIFFQETHVTSQYEYAWKQICGTDNIFFNHGTTNTAGLAIAFCKGDPVVRKSIVDKYG